MQKAGRKDIEQAFGVLQSLWTIVHGPACFWRSEKLKGIMYTCIILHKRIAENEEDTITNWNDDEGTLSSSVKSALKIFNCI